MKQFLLVIPPVLACICFFLLRSKRKSPAVIWYLYIVLFLSALGFFFYRVVDAVRHPNVYDFTAFFLWGKAAVNGYDFYLPQNLQPVFHSLQLPQLDYSGFSDEIVNVGFLYPPPTILFFAPLGFLSYESAIICWAIVNLCFALGSIYLIYDLFFRKDKLNGLILVTIMFVFFKPVLDTISALQTNFILLFYLLLVKKYSDKKISGVFAALAMFTKPYMAVLILFFIIKKKWDTVIYFLLTSVIIVGATFLFFGADPFTSYVFNSPTHRMPLWVFSEGTNQSLHAVLLRLNLISVERSYAYAAIALGIALLSTWYLVLLNKRRLYDFILPYLLVIALLVYPGTLSYYGVLLLFVIFQFFDEEGQLGFKSNVTTAAVLIFFILSTFSTFLCICFLLAGILFKSIRIMATTPRPNFKVGSELGT